MSEREPFAALLDLAQRSVAHASGLPAQLNIKPHWTGIGFQLRGQRMVAPMGEVAEILAVPGTTRLPGVQSWVRGVANVRGRLLPLIDLEAFFGGSLSGGRKSHRVLALELGDLFSGLIVSQVYGMQHIPVDQFSDQVPEALDFMSAYLAGSYRHNGHEWAVFSPFVLARDARFFNAAA
ncbi:MAG TPA: chemotaxis protein CheW [Spongiibacteraceae bacterium]|jgi:twitching motility protein PilI|nr:chemotaxis protein CheW [Spongiibacteraceae bacterium]HUH37333.1 chemotaxis protein CheW [Spongiibacteraceae bacterium]